MAVSVFLAGNLVNAQNTQGDWHIGGGVGYHLDFDDDNVGIVIEGLYSFRDDIRVAAGILYYFVDDDNTTFYDLNANAHYLFKNDEELRIYALAGINIFNVSVDFEGDSWSDDETGFNLGAGIEYDLTSIMLFGELKLTTGDIHDNNFLFHGGLRYRF